MYTYEIFYEDGTTLKSLFTYRNYDSLRKLVTSNFLNEEENYINIYEEGEEIARIYNTKKVFRNLYNEDKEKREEKMKTKEMPIIEVSKGFKYELDLLDIICDTNAFFERTGATEIDKELNAILEKYDEFTYKSQVIMYLVSTKNYTSKPKPVYNVLYGLISEDYYVWSNEKIPFSCNVFVKKFDNEEEAKKHAEKLNEFLEDNK